MNTIICKQVLCFSLFFCFTHFNFFLLAAPSHNRCTSLVCSCYVPSRNSFTQEDQNTKITTTNNLKKHLSTKSNANMSFKPCNDHPTPLKSNLRKASTILEINHPRNTQRKVSWPDAYGKDIAHIQEFEPSNASEDGELESVRNSCVCVIQ